MIHAAAGCVTRRHVAGAERDEDAYVCDDDAHAYDETMSTLIAEGLHPP